MSKTKVYSFSDPESPVFYNQVGQLCRRESRTVIPLDTNHPAYREQIEKPIVPMIAERVAPVQTCAYYSSRKIVLEGEWTVHKNGLLLEYRKQFPASINAMVAEARLLSMRCREYNSKAPASEWVCCLGDYFAALFLNMPIAQVEKLSGKAGENTNAQQNVIRKINELLTLLLKCAMMPHPMLDDENVQQYCKLIRFLYETRHVATNITGCFFAHYSDLTTLDAEMFGELLDHPDIKDDPVAHMLTGMLFLVEGISNHPEWLGIPAGKLMSLLEGLKQKRNSDASGFVLEFLRENVSTSKQSEIVPFLPTPKMLSVLAICAVYPEGVSSSRLQELLGESSKSIFQKNILEPLHQERLLELSIKDKKSSPLQKNMLTKLGRAVSERNGAVSAETQPYKTVSVAESTVRDADSNRTK